MQQDLVCKWLDASESVKLENPRKRRRLNNPSQCAYEAGPGSLLPVIFARVQSEEGGDIKVPILSPFEAFLGTQLRSQAECLEGEDPDSNDSRVIHTVDPNTCLYKTIPRAEYFARALQHTRISTKPGRYRRSSDSCLSYNRDYGTV